MTIINEIRQGLIEHMEYVEEQIARICDSGKTLTIHDMADLERYAKTLKYLADTYKSLD